MGRSAARALGLALVLLLASNALATSAKATSQGALAVHRNEVVNDAGLRLHHAFRSPTGWVKPGDHFVVTTRVTVGAGVDDEALVEVTAPPGASVVSAEAVGDVGEVVIEPGRVRWTPGGFESTAALVTEFVAATAVEDPRIVFKDLSSLATLRQPGVAPVSSASHGPKVIPATGGFESARYGDQPFPVVTVAYADRPARAGSDVAELDRVLNSPDVPGSTFNLYQEMSYGQLHPEGRVPTAGIAEASWDDVEVASFTQPTVAGVCRGTTLAATPALFGTPAAPSRIVDGWYQLPGDTEFYGGDNPAFPFATALVGLTQPHTKDTACGPASKLAYDAALIADPEIDYNDFDADRDGIVDFFMVVHVGCGGNGASQFGTATCVDAAPYDNVWPHSSSLLYDHADPDTGLRGYVSQDQLRSIREVPQCWTSPLRRTFADCAADGGDGMDQLPVPLRVGAYNVNPEDVLESASIISHEYGHHLGLPDLYNDGGFDSGGTFDLMAADYSQHLSVWGKQELGWVVPRPVAPGQRIETTMREIKQDTGQIHWWTPDGEPYVLSAASGDQNVHNGDAWVLELPSRITFTRDLFETGGTPDHVWYSGRANDLGCPPVQGHNLDVALPELRTLGPGTTVTLRFQSAWDIEWDWDYGFVLGTVDGDGYSSFPSANGYTTPSSYNPNSSACLGELDNGITGSSNSWSRGAPVVATDRVPGLEVYPEPLTFVEDEYDISSLVGGRSPSVRFGYHTDPAFDRPGWFIDDIEVLVDGEVLLSTDVEGPTDRTRIYPGGCDEDRAGPSVHCTSGFARLAAGERSPAAHAYHLELRDRSGFDFDGHGQSQRGLPLFEPGLFVHYTDEAHGYGNNSLTDHPAQHYLDSTPTPGEDCDDVPAATCHDSAFVDVEGRNRFTDASASPWQDNFWADADLEAPWTFGYDCLDVEVVSMQGEDTVQLVGDLTAEVVIQAGPGCAMPSVLAGGGSGSPVDPDPLPATGGGLGLLALLSLMIATRGVPRAR